MLQFAMLVLLWAPPQTSDTAPSVSKDLATKVTRDLQQQRKAGQLPNLQLDVSVRERVVTVSGQVDTRRQARIIMDTICDTDGVDGIQLNLGIKQPPSDVRPVSYLYPYYAPRMPSYPWPSYPGAGRKVELNWDDGWWQLNFEGDKLTAKTRLDGSADE